MKTLRQSLRHKRNTISVNDRRKYAQQLLVQLLKIVRFKNGKKIALYLPNDGEIDTKYIYDFLKNRGFRVYLPLLSGKKLKFAKIGSAFKKNKFNIDEPIRSKVLTPNQLNVIFLPLVGFDKQKNRLGMGSGFYDRTLAFKKQQKSYQNPKLYGLAFACQQVEKLQSQKWDVPLNVVITPTKIYR